MATRQEILSTAGEIIDGERDQIYGSAEDNFGRIAAYWSVLFGMKIEPWQVALAQDLVKTARLQNTPSHVDSWVDKAGYNALGGEIASSAEAA